MRIVVARFALVVAVVIVYHNALSASFFNDDFQWLVGSWSFRPAELVAFGSMTHFYRPVVDVYFALMTPLLRGSPVLFHGASIVLHAVTVLVVFSLAKRIDGRDLFAFAAALLFAVQPSDTEAIAWTSALSETISTLLGCLSLLWFLSSRAEQRRRFRVLSVGAFALALLTHESAVVFLPLLLLADRLLGRVRPYNPAPNAGVRQFAPYVALTVAYLGIDLWINTRNYVVAQGHYTLGLHIVTNALDYIQALYVGRRDWVNYAAIVAGVVALLLRGNPRVRFATCWMLLALAPFLAFNWGNTGRYLYQPAIGFSLLLAEAVVTLDRALLRRTNGVTRIAVVAAGITVIGGRFSVFAAANVHDFVEQSQVYPQYLARFRQFHGTLPPNAIVVAEPPTTLPHQFVNAAVQWDYRDPTIQVAPYESSDVR